MVRFKLRQSVEDLSTPQEANHMIEKARNPFVIHGLLLNRITNVHALQLKMLMFVFQVAANLLTING